MRFGSFTYLLKQGAKNTYLNKAMSFASVGVLTACLILVGLATLLSQNIKSVTKTIQQQNEIVIYVEDDISAADEAELDRQIRSMDNILEVKYTSKEQAFDEQKEKLGDLLDGYENEDVFPASYHIKVKDLTLIEENVSKLNALSGVEKVNAPTDIAEIMVKTDSGVSLGGTVVVVALLIVSFVIIMNTIKITVFSRRREINIMKYVGATNSFIRMPFLVEGMILGFISAIVSFFVVWYFYSQVLTAIGGETNAFIASATQALIPFSKIALPLLFSYVAAGVLIGGMGSLVSIRKHLKV